jgi:hypothetical protein
VLATAELVDTFLDSHRSPEYDEQPLANEWARVTKVCEEAAEALDEVDENADQQDWMRVAEVAKHAGKVWTALSKCTGENYHKGVCATEDALLSELGDCVSAALLAIQHRTKDTGATWAVVSAAFAKARDRVCDYAAPQSDTDG